MCDTNSLNWGKENLQRHEFENKRVIEIGSFDVNGSFRKIVTQFNPKEYIGTDLETGPGVDIVCSADRLVEKFGMESFDVIISTFVFEHINNWQECLSI